MADIRQEFLDEIQSDPENTSVRAIFADWLDEHDEPELADFMRSWSLDKYQKSVKYLTELAEYIQKEGRGKGYGVEDDWVFSYEELLEGLKEAYKPGGNNIYFSFDTPDELSGKRKQMWEAFQWVTSQPVAEDAKSNFPFRCGC